MVYLISIVLLVISIFWQDDFLAAMGVAYLLIGLFGEIFFSS